MAKYDSEYPDHPQHGLYEDAPYDDFEDEMESSGWGRRLVITVIALILVVVMVLSMVAQVQ